MSGRCRAVGVLLTGRTYQKEFDAAGLYYEHRLIGKCGKA